MARIAAEEMEGVAPEMEEGEATAILGAEMGGGKRFKPGDVIMLDVVSIDESDGSMTVKYHQEAEAPEGPMEALDRAFEEEGAGSEPTD